MAEGGIPVAGIAPVMERSVHIPLVEVSHVAT
jgi:hypothetical protein